MRTANFPPFASSGLCYRDWPSDDRPRYLAQRFFFILLGHFCCWCLYILALVVPVRFFGKSKMGLLPDVIDLRWCTANHFYTLNKLYKYRPIFCVYIFTGYWYLTEDIRVHVNLPFAKMKRKTFSRAVLYNIYSEPTTLWFKSFHVSTLGVEIFLP